MNRDDLRRTVECALSIRGRGLDHAEQRRLLEQITDALMVDAAYAEALRYALQHQCGLDVMAAIVDQRVQEAIARRFDEPASLANENTPGR